MDIQRVSVEREVDIGLRSSIPQVLRALASVPGKEIDINKKMHWGAAKLVTSIATLT